MNVDNGLRIIGIIKLNMKNQNEIPLPMELEIFNKSIAPFEILDHGSKYSFVLHKRNKYDKAFAEYRAVASNSAKLGNANGNGYDWEILLKNYISETGPANIPTLKYDSEAGLFCAYSEELDKLKIWQLNSEHSVTVRNDSKDLFSVLISAHLIVSEVYRQYKSCRSCRATAFTLLIYSFL